MRNLKPGIFILALLAALIGLALWFDGRSASEVETTSEPEIPPEVSGEDETEDLATEEIAQADKPADESLNERVDTKTEPIAWSGGPYEFHTLEERIEHANIVADVIVTDIGPVRFNTSDGRPPESTTVISDLDELESSDEDFELRLESRIATQAITMTVTTIHKSEIEDLKTIITYKWPEHDSRLNASISLSSYDFSIGDSGLVLMSDFYGNTLDTDEKGEDSELEIYWAGLAAALPADQKPAFVGAIHEWLVFRDGVYRGGNYPDESFEVDEMAKRLTEYQGR